MTAARLDSAPFLEGCLSLVAGLVVCFLVALFNPAASQYRPPLQPSEWVPISNDCLKEYDEADRKRLAAYAKSRTKTDAVGELLRHGFPALLSVTVLWLAWRPLRAGKDVALFFAPLLVLMLGLFNYLPSLNWLLVLALAAAAWKVSARNLMVR